MLTKNQVTADSDVSSDQNIIQTGVMMIGDLRPAVNEGITHLSNDRG